MKSINLKKERRLNIHGYVLEKIHIFGKKKHLDDIDMAIRQMETTSTIRTYQLVREIQLENKFPKIQKLLCRNFKW